MRDINLLPEILREKQKTRQAHLLANTGSVILLIFAATVLFAVFSYRVSLTRNLTSLNQEQGNLENSVAQLREEEGLYRFLALKLSAFAENLETRQIYGAKIARIREIFSNTASLIKLAVESGEKVAISGEVVSFPELAVKLASLNKEDLFENFEIASLGINQEKGVVEFVIEGKLK